MTIVATILVILHFIGLALLLGGFLVQLKAIAQGKGVVMRVMLEGALTQLVTGLALVGIYSAGLVEGEEVDNAKIAVYTCPVDMTTTETKGTVLIKTAAELTDFSRGEETLLVVYLLSDFELFS